APAPDPPPPCKWCESPRLVSVAEQPSHTSVANAKLQVRAGSITVCVSLPASLGEQWSEDRQAERDEKRFVVVGKRQHDPAEDVVAPKVGPLELVLVGDPCGSRGRERRCCEDDPSVGGVIPLRHGEQRRKLVREIDRIVRRSENERRSIFTRVPVEVGLV